MTKIIIEALEITKQRGIINKGWGGLGNRKFPVLPLCFLSMIFLLYITCQLAHSIFMLYCFFSVAGDKDFIYLLDNCPHDWLFLQCASVVSCLKYSVHNVLHINVSHPIY